MHRAVAVLVIQSLARSTSEAHMLSLGRVETDQGPRCRRSAQSCTPTTPTTTTTTNLSGLGRRPTTRSCTGLDRPPSGSHVLQDLHLRQWALGQLEGSLGVFRLQTRKMVYEVAFLGMGEQTISGRFARLGGAIELDDTTKTLHLCDWQPYARKKWKGECVCAFACAAIEQEGRGGRP
ncbi:hypothetical protein F4780DRAFT_106704 [Xylariomycetidae sp. FL0641]|nr:hypothetical protein F4780DRAFT_106704 [Xylariomycetidae sp. FL0641]